MNTDANTTLVSTPAIGNEHFVDVATAATFLSITPRFLLDLVRAGDLPGYPLGTGARRIWRFRVTELSAGMEQLRSSRLVYGKSLASYRSKPATRSARGQ